MMNSAFKIRTSILDLHQQEESSRFHQEEKQRQSISRASVLLIQLNTSQNKH